MQSGHQNKITLCGDINIVVGSLSQTGVKQQIKNHCCQIICDVTCKIPISFIPCSEFIHSNQYLFLLNYQATVEKSFLKSPFWHWSAVRISSRCIYTQHKEVIGLSEATNENIKRNFYNYLQSNGWLLLYCSCCLFLFCFGKSW